MHYLLLVFLFYNIPGNIFISLGSPVSTKWVTSHYHCDNSYIYGQIVHNLIVIVQVYSNPTLCMSAQLNPAALPSGSIPMAAVTPLAGLVHWCALAPIYSGENTGRFL